MISRTTNRTTRFHRCAVCKIDLKGRFVFVDDVVEHLLGYTKEDLFGRSILDFLTQDSKALTVELLSQRNHYETFFDSTEFTLIGAGGQPITASAVVSLNFIAGNPANFQIILDKRAAVTKSPSLQDNRLPIGELVSDLLALETPSDLKPMLASLREYTGAAAAYLYVIGDGSIEPRCGACRDETIGSALAAIPPATDLHRRVAETGSEYSFADQDAVRRAIEADGAAPHEFVRSLDLATGHQYLLRMTFDPDLAPDQAREAVERAGFALALAQRLLSRSTTHQSSSDLDVQFTIGFLDHIGIGAALTDALGTLVGYNRSLLAMLQVDELGDSLGVMAELLQNHNDTEALRILSLIEDRPPAVTGDASSQINLPSGDMARMMLVRLSDTPQDLTSCLVMVPSAGCAEPDDNVPDPFWSEVYDTVKLEVTGLRSGLQNLSHAVSGQLGKQQDEVLGRLRQDSDRLKRVLDDLSLIATDTGEAEHLLVDMNLLAREILQELSPWHPEVNVRWQYNGPSKVVADLELVRRLMQICLSNCLRFCRNYQCEIQIEAVQDDNFLKINISDDGLGIPKEYQARVFDAGFQVPRRGGRQHPGAGTGLTLARRLLRQRGGRISVSSATGQGTRVSLILALGPH
ncbi:MAG: PAS domain-containing sensor histidine kinase [bacterium]